MRFLVDSMLPPEVADLLVASGHDATTPARLGAHNLPDDVLLAIAADDGMIVVTENASDFASAPSCAVLLVRKSWWPGGRVASRLAVSLDRWAAQNPEPGPWAHWLPSDLR